MSSMAAPLIEHCVAWYLNSKGPEPRAGLALSFVQRRLTPTLGLVPTDGSLPISADYQHLAWQLEKITAYTRDQRVGGYSML